MSPEEDDTWKEESENLLHDVNLAKRLHGKRPQLYLWFLHLISLIFFVISLSFLLFAWNTGSRLDCIQQTSTFSPALDALKSGYQTVQFIGSLSAPSPYKGPPNPDVDAVWKRIAEVPGFSISHETLLRIGASEDAVRLPPESGGGYMAALEAVHQLHCVNLLWQVSYKEYYASRALAFRDSPAILRMHLDHCADLLRQKLMCDADAGIITYRWLENHSHPFPNFNTKHQCRDFEALRQWNVDHMAPAPKNGRVEKLPGSVVVNEAP